MTLLTTAAVAAMANVTARTIENEVARGNLRRTKLGRSVRFADADVKEWLRSGRNSNAAAR